MESWTIVRLIKEESLDRSSISENSKKDNPKEEHVDQHCRS
jgi:hypothetical protein